MLHYFDNVTLNFKNAINAVSVVFELFKVVKQSYDMQEQLIACRY